MLVSVYSNSEVRIFAHLFFPSKSYSKKNKYKMFNPFRSLALTPVPLSSRPAPSQLRTLFMPISPLPLRRQLSAVPIDIDDDESWGFACPPTPPAATASVAGDNGEPWELLPAAPFNFHNMVELLASVGPPAVLLASSSSLSPSASSSLSESASSDTTAGSYATALSTTTTSTMSEDGAASLPSAQLSEATRVRIRMLRNDADGT
jgi:hypothetical protein